MSRHAASPKKNISVKDFAMRICNLEDEKEALNSDINEIYDEASENDIDKKALRQAVKAKRKEIDADYKQRVNDYLDELGEPKLFALV